MSFKDVLIPFTAWKNLLAEPVTIKKPEEIQGAPRYRGFHFNDIEQCIGCGTCEEICQNESIDMVSIMGIESKDGDSGLRPMIDYGRCCWCALCIDVCTTNSLTLTNSFKWTAEDPKEFRFIPGVDKKYWDDDNIGYRKPDGYDLYSVDRIPMNELEPGERDDSFAEIIKGYSKEQAMKEADRCVECGICTATCPAHMGIPAYIKAIRENDLEEGLRILYETNPLPEVCGRVCTHKCETVCSMTHKGDALSIRWLKRYIADQIPSEKYKKILGTDKIQKNGNKVAIIGAGPAGLSAAHYLVLLGYSVRIYESKKSPGGMVRYGIPEYRMPYDQLEKDIEYIKSLGVEIQFNTVVGQNIQLEELEKDYNAVFAATGLQIGRSTGVPGADNKGVYQAIELLRKITDGEEIDLAEKIVVIGGGNVAMDITRTLARFQNRKYGKVGITATCLESEETMPADDEEVKEAREENAVIDPGWGPTKIEIEEGKIKGLHIIKCLSVFDKEGMFNPKFDENQKKFLEAEIIIESIGQGMNILYTDNIKNQIEFDRRGRILVNKNFQSKLQWFFVGGDIIEGPDVIHGIANGHKAALGIDKFLSEIKQND